MTLRKRKLEEIPTPPPDPPPTRIRHGLETSPFKEGSSRTSIQIGDAVPSTPQDALKSTVKSELTLRTFESKTVMDDIFGPVDLQLSERIIDTLKKEGTGPNNGTLFYPDESGLLSKFPASASRERIFYSPLTSLLNRIIRTTERLSVPLPFYTNLSFAVYDTKMKDSYGNAHRIKPDILGLLSNTPHDYPIVHQSKRQTSREAKIEGLPGQYWWMVKVACEVKSEWSDMVAQMATYARCMLAAIPSRRYALVLGFNYKHTEARFCFFHRGGLMATPSMKLSEPDGFKVFVKFVVQMATCANATRAGIDDTCDSFHYRLPNIGIRSIKNVLCDRGGLTGRGTKVAELGDPNCNRNLPNTPGYVELGRDAAPNNLSDVLDDVQYQEAALEKKVNKDHQLMHGPAVNIDDLRQPPDIKELEGLDTNTLTCAIIKESYIPNDRSNEEQVFHDAQGRFGIPNITCSYELEGWGSIFCPDAKPWSVFRQSNVPHEEHQQDERVFTRTLYQTRGYPIFFARGPRQLLQVILHAMIGHWELLQSGWLHRDVSTGNILLLREAEKRQSCAFFSQTKGLEDCIGVLIDGDQAVNWKSGRKALGLHRSFTRPFLSRRIAMALKTDKKVELHTPQDDLESFLWVLFFTILEIGHGHKKLKPNEVPWLEEMHEEDTTKLTGKVPCLQNLILQARTTRQLSDHLLIFGGILERWNTIAEETHEKLMEEIYLRIPAPELLENSESAYAKYLASGFEILETLPSSWEEGWAYGKMLRKAHEAEMTERRKKWRVFDDDDNSNG